MALPLTCDTLICAAIVRIRVRAFRAAISALCAVAAAIIGHNRAEPAP